jgi:NAD(P)-dependent dehydrogenase (short-subunit alcohol dehydrogenase family)
MILAGKSALVTGGGSGIGAGIARRFAAEGANVCLTGLYRAELEAVAATLPTASAVCEGDVSDLEDVGRMIETALRFNGGIDVLVNCAGVSLTGSVTNIPLESWQKSLDVNLSGPFLMMRTTIPHMIRAGGGSIINISSLAALRSLSNHCAYTASKSGLIALTQQAALDYGKDNIRVNAVCPGFVLTAMSGRWLEEVTEGKNTDVDTLLSDAVRDLPLKHVGTPESIAGICVFLASDDSSYMTGAVLPADGGVCVVDAFALGLGSAIERMNASP